MVHKPRWLKLATAGIVALMVVARVYARPSRADRNAARQRGPPASTTATTRPSTAASPTTVASAPASVPASAPASQPAPSSSVAPLGTPYPEMLEQPTEPSEIADVYPNYGEEVDCDADTWNGVPYAGTMKKISAPDPQTVVFELCGPNVAFLSILGFNVFSIYDSEWLTTHTADKSHLATMNGTGAYKFDSWQRGTEIDYSLNADYWGEAATNAKGILKWNGETAARLQELQAGTTDGIMLVGPEDFQTVKDDSTLQLLEGTALNTTYLGFNHDFDPWGDVKVREAISLALNRQRIVDNSLSTRIRSC